MKDKINNAIDKLFKNKYLGVTVSILVLFIILKSLGDTTEAHLQATVTKRIVVGLIFLLASFLLGRGAMYYGRLSKKTLKGFVLLLVPFLLAGYVLSGKLVTASAFDPQAALLAVLVGLAAGLTEEFMTRGLPLGQTLPNVKSYKEMLTLVLVSACFFSVLHLGHVFMGEASLSETIPQLAQALGLGVLFTAAFLRSGSLVPGIVCHAFWDACVSYTPADLAAIESQTQVAAGTQVGAILLISVPFLLMGLFMLRKSKWGEIKENFGITESID